MEWKGVQVGPVFAGVTYDTGLEHAGPFCCGVGAGQQ